MINIKRKHKIIIIILTILLFLILIGNYSWNVYQLYLMTLKLDDKNMTIVESFDYSDKKSYNTLEFLFMEPSNDIINGLILEFGERYKLKNDTYIWTDVRNKKLSNRRIDVEVEKIIYDYEEPKNDYENYYVKIKIGRRDFLHEYKLANRYRVMLLFGQFSEFIRDK